MDYQTYSGIGAQENKEIALIAGNEMDGVKVAKFGSKMYNKGLASNTLDRNQKLLIANKGNFDRDTQAAMGRGDLKVYDACYYVSRWLQNTGTGAINKLLEPSSELIVGLTNFDKNKLQTGENLIVEGIGIQYGSLWVPSADPQPSQASLRNVHPAEVIYHNQAFAMNINNNNFQFPNPVFGFATNGFWQALVPTTFLSSELTIGSGGQALVSRDPMAKYFVNSWVGDNKVQNITDTIKLKAPKIIYEGKDIGIEIRNPENSGAFPTSVTAWETLNGASVSKAFNVYHFVKVSLHGQVTRYK